MIKRSNSDQMSLLEKPLGGGKGVLQEGAGSRCGVGREEAARPVPQPLILSRQQ